MHEHVSAQCRKAVSSFTPMQCVTSGSEPFGQHALVATLPLSTFTVVLQNVAAFNVMVFVSATDAQNVEKPFAICIR